MAGRVRPGRYSSGVGMLLGMQQVNNLECLNLDKVEKPSPASTFTKGRGQTESVSSKALREAVNACNNPLKQGPLLTSLRTNIRPCVFKK